MFERPAPGSMKIQTAVFGWIVLLNFAVQVWKVPLEEAGFCSWAFFLNSVLYFLSGEEDTKKRFLGTLFGSVVGIALSVLLVTAATALQAAGLSAVPAVMLPLVLCLAVMILLQPYCPLVFNNAGFGYFIVALISAETAVPNAVSYLVSDLAGLVLVVGGSILLIRFITRAQRS